HRQPRDPSRSQADGSPRVPVDRHLQERHAEGRTADPQRRSQSRLGPAESPHAPLARRSDGAPAVAHGEDEEQPGIPRLDELRKVLMRTRRFGRTGWQVSEIGYGMWGMGGWTGSD